MIDFRNPYTPGAGKTPKYLAGRDDFVLYATQCIKATASGYLPRSIVYYGLRGVGKTVLLNIAEEVCDENNVLVAHIEVKDNSNLVKALSLACNKFAQELSTKEIVKDRLNKLLCVFQSFTTKWNPEDNTFSFELGDFHERYGNAGTGDLAHDFTELLVTLGKYAKQSEDAICFCIDEIQYAKDNELEALVTALHRVNQLDLPIIFFCAGLPKILKSMGELKSYTERLFEFLRLDSLDEASAIDAIRKPASTLGVSYTNEAISKIIKETQGYPYFIQEICNTIWHEHCPTKIIELDDVNRYLGIAYKKLDDGFFMVRYDRCTSAEKSFMNAMVLCGELPCNIANVAKIMGRPVGSISIFRSQLIAKGLIYATGHGEIDFTVPQFDLFLRRISPETFQ